MSSSAGLGDDDLMSFSSATALLRTPEGSLGWEVPDGWQQGRGAWGGLVAGGVVRAVEAHEPDPSRRLRTVSLHLPGPLGVGGATVRVDPLRIGSAMSTWSVTVESAGDLCAHAVVLTGSTRVPAETTLGWGTSAAPPLPPWQDLPLLPTGLPGMPAFMQQLELRPAEGLPLAGTQARCTGYVRFVDQGSWDAAQLVGIVDAWYPTALAALAVQRPLATVTSANHLLLDPETVPAGQPLVYEAAMAAANDGFTTETRRLWTLDGRLAVENHQSVVIIR